MSKKIEKVYAIVAHFEVNILKCSRFGALFEVEMLKKAQGCGAKQISEFKKKKSHMFGAPLDVEASFRVTGTMASALCVAESYTER